VIRFLQSEVDAAHLGRRVNALLPIDEQRAVHGAQDDDHRCKLREHPASMPDGSRSTRRFRVSSSRRL
jgi:hypothetical protein